MAKTAVYGIDSIKFATPVAGSFPAASAWTAFTMKAIVKDGFSFNEQAASETDIECEDFEDYYAVLKNGVRQETFTIQTYDMDAEAYKFFFGYHNASAGGASVSSGSYLTETIGFELGNKAVQVTTKALGSEIPAKQFEWASMSITVTRTGTLGKSGFPNINIECKKCANVNSAGSVVSAGARWRNL